MKVFTLPDLGEGLPEAVIREWHVEVNAQVTTDQPLVSVETAKALVEVPAPYDGTIEQLFGQPGDTIETGQPLVGFQGEEINTEDAGTVVGRIETNDSTPSASTDIIAPQQTTTHLRATPAVRALARRLKVDLTQVRHTGERITKDDVKRAAVAPQTELMPHYQPLSATQKAMALTMQHAHQEVVPITVTDDADISAWFKQHDLTTRVISAIIKAVAAEPILNAHFDSTNLSYRAFDEIHLGLAVDSPHGLFVPVLQSVNHHTPEHWRERINTFKQQAETKSIHQDDLHGATLILSNFGRFAARYATPVVTPPTVAIIGTGRVCEMPVVRDGQLQAAHCLPLSISADHRLITGGQLTRFLAEIKDALEHSSNCQQKS